MLKKVNAFSCLCLLYLSSEPPIFPQASLQAPPYFRNVQITQSPLDKKLELGVGIIRSHMQKETNPIHGSSENSASLTHEAAIIFGDTTCIGDITRNSLHSQCIHNADH